MAKPKPDPKQLALHTIAGAILIACTFPISLLPFRHSGPTPGFSHLPKEQWLHLFALLIPLASGGAIWFLANKRLKRGYAANLWSDAELAPVRALLARRFWTWGSVVLFAAALLAMAFVPRAGGLLYVVTCPGHAVTALRRLLIPPTEKMTTGLSGWPNAKPLHSDHWGKSPQSSNHTLPS